MMKRKLQHLMTLLKQTKIFPIKLNLTANELGLTLRQRMKLGVTIALASLVIVLYSISSTLLQNSIQVAETQNTRQAVESVLSIVAQSEEDFRDRFLDWSAWDDTYSFITSQPQNYITSNLTPETLSGMKVNLVLYINNGGKIVYGTEVDLDKKQKIRLSDSIKQQITANSALLRAPGKAEILTGIVMLPSGPMLLTSQPILTSRRTGPMRGTLIFGKYLDTERIQNLTNRYYLTVREINAAQLPSDFSAARSSLLEDTRTFGPQSSTRANILIRPLDEKTIAGYTIVNDIYGKPALLIRVDVPREIYRQGVTNLRYLFASLVIVGLAFGAIATLMLDKLLSIQRKRRESEILYRVVVTQASEGIFLLDANSKRFLETNAAFANLLGYTPKEILQLGLDDLVVKNGDKFNQHIQQITSQHHFTAEQQYRRKEGRFIDVEINANLIRYAGRDVLCVVVRDITSRKRTEMSLRQQAKAERIVGAMTQRIRQSLDLDEILNTTVAEVREFLLRNWGDRQRIG
jgi:PAS domain S-box-containing protein